MKPGEYLRWLNRSAPMAPANDNLANGTTIRHVHGFPPADEMDAGYYLALALGPRVVGEQVPLAVAQRLLEAGLVRVVPAKS